MTSPRSRPFHVSALVGLLFLAGCGGGGGAKVQNSPTPPPTPSAPYQTTVSTGATVGKNAAAAILGNQGTLSSVQWTQTAGPAVTLLSDKTQAISFETTQAGSYQFAVSFKDPAGVKYQESIVVPVTGAPASTSLALRVSQAVRMGGSVSVRAWPRLSASDAVQSIHWSQIEGPSVQLDTTDPFLATFTAPMVSSDTVIRLRATLTTANGLSDFDTALVVVEAFQQASSSDASAVWSNNHVSRTYPYRSAGPYAEVLTNAVYDPALRDSNLVPLSKLPFIGQETKGEIPTVDQVMNHVVVSHDWLGENFETFLKTKDANGDFRRLLNSVTAVVLGVQVRPSFYYAVTGAIYLDADNFWLTPEQRDTVNEVPDYRTGFDKELNYSTPWRYVRGNSYLFHYYDSRSRITRSVDDLKDESGWLLYHELGHAADFLPPSLYATLNSSTGAWGNIAPRYSAKSLTSDYVAAHYPLTSSIMYGLGQVSFQGVAATDVQKAYSPDQVATFFSPDLATDAYNYSNAREDIAMTFEEFMMATRTGAQRDVAISDKITSNTTGSNLTVRWGQRGRVGAVSISPRLREIVQRLTPWVVLSTVDTLPAPTAMRAGESWVANLTLGVVPPRGTSQALQVGFPQESWTIDKAAFRKRHIEMKLPPF